MSIHRLSCVRPYGRPPRQSFIASVFSVVAAACGAPVDRVEPSPLAASDNASPGTSTHVDSPPPAPRTAQEEATGRRTEGPFVERVVAYTPGDGAGFGQASMPWIVLGGPRGEGALRGSTDVVSLGSGGSIVLAFDANPIVDGSGADFLVFENAFRCGPAQGRVFAEFAQVSVSADGDTWVPFECDAANGLGCAGSNPVFANIETNALSCVDEAVAGGDAFDLAAVGVPVARFVRIDDRRTFSGDGGDGKTGFDLDAIAAIHRVSSR